MTTSILPVAAIQALHLTCRNCGAAAVIPLSARHAPAQCFNCATPFPAGELMRLVGELRWLKDTTGARDAGIQVDFDAALEHEAPQ